MRTTTFLMVIGLMAVFALIASCSKQGKAQKQSSIVVVERTMTLDGFITHIQASNGTNGTIDCFIVKQGISCVR